MSIRWGIPRLTAALSLAGLACAGIEASRREWWYTLAFTAIAVVAAEMAHLMCASIRRDLRTARRVRRGTQRILWDVSNVVRLPSVKELADGWERERYGVRKP